MTSLSRMGVLLSCRQGPVPSPRRAQRGPPLHRESPLLDAGQPCHPGCLMPTRSRCTAFMLVAEWVSPGRRSGPPMGFGTGMSPIPRGLRGRAARAVGRCVARCTGGLPGASELNSACAPPARRDEPYCLRHRGHRACPARCPRVPESTGFRRQHLPRSPRGRGCGAEAMRARLGPVLRAPRLRRPVRRARAAPAGAALPREGRARRPPQRARRPPVSRPVRPANGRGSGPRGRRPDWDRADCDSAARRRGADARAAHRLNSTRRLRGGRQCTGRRTGPRPGRRGRGGRGGSVRAPSLLCRDAPSAARGRPQGPAEGGILGGLLGGAALQQLLD